MAIDVITSSGSWVCPAGVYQIIAECIGGGASGGFGASDFGSGGGGGGCGKGYLAVTPGNSYAVTVGAGGSGVGATLNDGGDSNFVDAATVKAAGGKHGSSGGSGGLGGTANVGNLATHNGGAGGHVGGFDTGGASGGGAGSATANGGNGSSTTGGGDAPGGTSFEGAGANGQVSFIAGHNGNNYGGGGGGAGHGDGGNGADGVVRVYYVEPIALDPVSAVTDAIAGVDLAVSCTDSTGTGSDVAVQFLPKWEVAGSGSRAATIGVEHTLYSA